jgi:hypothetical protein
MRYHFGLGVGHLYVRPPTLAGSHESTSENLHPLDVSEADLALGEDDSEACSELVWVPDEENDMGSGSEHSLDHGEDEEDDTELQDDVLEDEELNTVAEMYGLDFVVSY